MHNEPLVEEIKQAAAKLRQGIVEANNIDSLASEI
jgi:hypothetical protein